MIHTFKRFVCFYNSSSGGGRAVQLRARIESRAEHNDFDVEFVEVRSIPKDITESNNFKEFCGVLVAGGDGTISHLLPMLIELGLPVGLLPMGTGNDLARDIGILDRYDPEKPEILLAEFAKLRTKKINLFVAKFVDTSIHAERIFSNYLSVGFDAAFMCEYDLLRKRAPWLQRKFGRLGASLLASVAISKKLFKRVPEGTTLVGSNGQAVSLPKYTKGLLISNVRSCAGLGWSNKISDPSDSRLEAVVFESFFDYFNILLCTKTPISESQGFKIELPESCAVQIDGEPSFDAFSGEISISPCGGLDFLSAGGIRFNSS